MNTDIYFEEAIIKYPMVAPRIIESIFRYANDHCPVGGFLKAVLTNDLAEAMMRADSDNRLNLFSIVQICYYEIPDSCWGSEEKYKKWIMEKPTPIRAGE